MDTEQNNKIIEEVRDQRYRLAGASGKLEDINEDLVELKKKLGTLAEEEKKRKAVEDEALKVLSFLADTIK